MEICDVNGREFMIIVLKILNEMQENKDNSLNSGNKLENKTNYQRIESIH